MLKIIETLETMLLEKKRNIKNLNLDYIRYKQLNWYGHIQRMNEERPPRRILECVHKRKSLKFVLQEVTLGMREKRITTWNYSTGKNGERKSNFRRRNKPKH